MKKFEKTIVFLSFIVAVLSLLWDIYQNNEIKQLNSQVNNIQQMDGSLFLNNKLEGNGVGIQFNNETRDR